MKSLDDLAPVTRKAAEAFTAAVGQELDLAGALVFGSRARGTQRHDSDLDIAVLLNDPSGDFVTTKLALADIAYDVLLETGIRIQPLPIWHDEWSHPEQYSNPKLLENIQRDGIVL